MGLQVDQGLSFWGEFIDPVLEDEYRLFDLPATKQGIRGFIMIAFVATVVFTVMESLFKSWSTPGLAGVQCTRLVLVLVFPLVWMLVGHSCEDNWNAQVLEPILCGQPEYNKYGVFHRKKRD